MKNTANFKNILRVNSKAKIWKKHIDFLLKKFANKIQIFLKPNRIEFFHAEDGKL